MTQRIKKTKFISPLLLLLATLILSVSLLIVALSYFPLATLLAVAVIAISVRMFVKREHLTFFYEEYEPDIFATDITEEDTSQ
jgi:hypothetical protein